MRLFEKTYCSIMMEYHISKGLTLSESVFRLGSESFDELINEARKLWKEGKLELNGSDQFIVEKLKTGQKGMYQGKEVKLDSPTRISTGDKKFRVYTDSGKKDKDGNIKALKIEWGDPNATIKNDDPEASASFLARHKCSTKKDPKTAGYWACHAPELFGKQIGLSSTKPW